MSPIHPILAAIMAALAVAIFVWSRKRLNSDYVYKKHPVDAPTAADPGRRVYPLRSKRSSILIAVLLGCTKVFSAVVAVVTLIKLCTELAGGLPFGLFHGAVVWAAALYATFVLWDEWFYIVDRYYAPNSAVTKRTKGWPLRAIYMAMAVETIFLLYSLIITGLALATTPVSAGSTANQGNTPHGSIPSTGATTNDTNPNGLSPETAGWSQIGTYFNVGHPDKASTAWLACMKGTTGVTPEEVKALAGLSGNAPDLRAILATGGETAGAARNALSAQHVDRVLPGDNPHMPVLTFKSVTVYGASGSGCKPTTWKTTSATVIATIPQNAAMTKIYLNMGVGLFLIDGEYRYLPFYSETSPSSVDQ